MGKMFCCKVKSCSVGITTLKQSCTSIISENGSYRPTFHSKHFYSLFHFKKTFNTLRVCKSRPRPSGYRSIICKQVPPHFQDIGLGRIHSSCNLLLENLRCQDSSNVTFGSVKEILDTCTRRLDEEKIDESNLQAEYIVAHTLGIVRNELKNVMNKPISAKELENIGRMMDCKLARMPVQYIIGDWDFHSVKLKLRPPVFIPRPETETLVNIAIRHLKDIGKPVALDIGCGSGAICLSLLNHYSELKCAALDQSKYATDLTLENAQDLHVSDRLDVILGKATVSGFPTFPYKEFDLIVSNPPYVLKKDLLGLEPEITLYEDLRALDGGIEGLDIIKNIILHGQHLLRENGCLLLEVDPCHQYLLPNWLEENDTTIEVVKFYKDINGTGRFVKLAKKNILCK